MGCENRYNSWSEQTKYVQGFLLKKEILKKKDDVLKQSKLF